MAGEVGSARPAVSCCQPALPTMDESGWCGSRRNTTRIPRSAATGHRSRGSRRPTRKLAASCPSVRPCSPAQKDPKATFLCADDCRFMARANSLASPCSCVIHPIPSLQQTPLRGGFGSTASCLPVCPPVRASDFQWRYRHRAALRMPLKRSANRPPAASSEMPGRPGVKGYTTPSGRRHRSSGAAGSTAAEMPRWITRLPGRNRERPETRRHCQ
jgi:hypothetical protein